MESKNKIYYYIKFIAMATVYVTCRAQNLTCSQNMDLGSEGSIIEGFEPRHNARDTAVWMPEETKTIPDTCSSSVAFSFKSPPREYGFTKLTVELRENGQKIVQTNEFDITSLDEELLCSQFHNVSNGRYRFKVFLNYNEYNTDKFVRDCKCKMERFCVTRCIPFDTKFFTLNANARECFITPNSTSNGTLEAQNGDNKSSETPKEKDALLNYWMFFVVAILGMLFIILTVVFAYVRVKNRSTASEIESDFVDEYFGDSASAVLEYMHDKHSHEPTVLILNEHLRKHNKIGYEPKLDHGYPQKSRFPVSQIHSVADTSIITVPQVKSITEASILLNANNNTVTASKFISRSNSNLDSAVCMGSYFDTVSNASRALNKDNATQSSKPVSNQETTSICSWGGDSCSTGSSDESNIPSNYAPTIPIGRDHQPNKTDTI